MIQTDLIIIGSGPGGYEAAAFAAKHGLQVVIAEEAFAGGTCLNCGCIPTKALIHDAEKLLPFPMRAQCVWLPPSTARIRLLMDCGKVSKLFSANLLSPSCTDTHPL